MNRRPAPARSLVVPGALLLTVSFAFVGCAKSDEPAEDESVIAQVRALRNADDVVRHYNDEYEEAIAVCMKAEGFEYTPVPLPDDIPAARGDDTDLVAEAKEHGYRITPASKDALIEQYSTDESTDDHSSRLAEGDPNGAYYASLPASDRAAYDVAMWGTDPEDDTVSGSTTTDGCMTEASQHMTEYLAGEPDSTVVDDLEQYASVKVGDDPRVGEAEVVWASCMADKGYSFATSGDAPMSIQERFDTLVGSEERTEAALGQISDQDLADLRDDEIATATADIQCYASDDVQGVYETIQHEAETEFYRTHKSEVDAWLAAQEAWQNQLING